MLMMGIPISNDKSSKLLAAEYAWDDLQNVPETIVELPILSRDAFEELKHKTRMLFIYCHKILSENAKLLDSGKWGFALLGPGDELLRLYGTPDFLSLASAHHLEAGTLLRRDLIGTTAISISKKYHKSCLTEGEDHRCHLLKDLFIAFAPCYYNSLHDESEETYLGGIAAFGLPGNCERECLMLVSSQMRSACITISKARGFLHWQEASYGKIIFNYDKLPLIIYCSPFAKGLLSLPVNSDIIFTPISCTFDPLPLNEEFWNIFYHKQAVTNYPITLSIHGNLGQYTISTLYEHQQMLDYETFSVLFRSNFIRTYEEENDSRQASAQYTFDNIVGRSKELLSCIESAKRYAKIDMNLLITGERGTGKDIFAQAVHNGSPRRKGPFIAINCAAMPKELITSELFGYEHGAFSGGRKEGYCGKLSLAEGGTLFLDEIGDMPLDLQAVLLRAVEGKQFMRLGGTKLITCDVRFIFATNTNLPQMVKEGTFRGDLFDRIRALRLDIPPLRARGDDTAELADSFLLSVCKKASIPEKVLSHDAVSFLREYPWPGNVRELKNTIEAAALTSSTRTIPVSALQTYLADSQRWEPEPGYLNQNLLKQDVSTPYAADTVKSKRIIHTFTPELIMDVLQKNHYNKTATAEQLGISRKTLYQRMKDFNIAP